MTGSNYRIVHPHEIGLVEKQRAGRLYWQDSAPRANRKFNLSSSRKVQLSKHRRDFTEKALRAYAFNGELFERIDPPA